MHYVLCRLSKPTACSFFSREDAVRYRKFVLQNILLRLEDKFVWSSGEEADGAGGQLDLIEASGEF